MKFESIKSTKIEKKDEEKKEQVNFLEKYFGEGSDEVEDVLVNKASMSDLNSIMMMQVK